MARQLGHDAAVPLLQETLEEEKATDEKLTRIAEGVANADAPAGEAASSGRAGKAKAAA
jgi:ferritin-like metal-binding protein YciE